MKRPLLLCLALFVLGAAPSPLVVGSVRDQDGAPIAGANVNLAGSAAAVQTAADGTFALTGTGNAVEIRCAYCRPTEAAIAADGTVTAIVLRYDAVRLEGPSRADLANLPYTHAESNVSLTPWIVLEQNGNPAIGSSLHDRSVYTYGGLLVLDGIPDYNSADGITTYTTIPYNATTDVDVERVPQAYEYGDLANFGTFSVTTTGGTSYAAAGSSAIGGLAVNGTNSASVGVSSDGSGARSRGTLLLAMPISDATLGVTLASGSGDNSSQQTLQSSFSAFRLGYERTSGADLYASITGDLGTDNYTLAEYFPGYTVPPSFYANDRWSDFDGRIGIRSRAIVAPFAEVDVHTSTGWYEAPGIDEYTDDLVDQSTAGTIDQSRVYAGINATLPWLRANVAYGIDAVHFVDMTAYQENTDQTGHDASATLELRPTAAWDLAGSANAGYVLQNVLGYAAPGSTQTPPLMLVSSDELNLTYMDLRRVRVGLTTFGTQSQYYRETSDGAFVAWQIAPTVSLRTWWLEAHPQSAPQQSVGSAWLTATTGALRFDVIWRRDLYNFAGNAHLDGSVSGPFGVHARWFAQTEQFAHVRMTNVGIRF